MLHAYDQPVMETNCTRRNRSTVSTQALTLLNSDSAIQYAGSLADRAVREAPETPCSFAFLAALSREPGTDELSMLNEFLTTQQARYSSAGELAESSRQKALADLCHMLLVSNEFVYVD